MRTNKQLPLIKIDYEEEAIEFIREHEPPDGYFLGFSGGKDSVVLYDLTKRSGVKFEPWYSATGIDPPEVVRFIRENYPDVRWARPTMSFWNFIQKKGVPTKQTRWCCDHLKKIPTKKVKLKHRLMGLRAEESYKRAERGRISNYLYRQVFYKPIFNWKEWQVWEYIDNHELPYCELYDQGFSRIGCVICPFICGGNKSSLLQHMERWPKYYKTFEHAMRRLYESRIKDRGYDENFDHFINAWYDGFLSINRQDNYGLFGD